MPKTIETGRQAFLQLLIKQRDLECAGFLLAETKKRAYGGVSDHFTKKWMPPGLEHGWNKTTAYCKGSGKNED